MIYYYAGPLIRVGYSLSPGTSWRRLYSAPRYLSGKIIEGEVACSRDIRGDAASLRHRGNRCPARRILLPSVPPSRLSRSSRILIGKTRESDTFAVGGGVSPTLFRRRGPTKPRPRWIPIKAAELQGPGDHPDRSCFGNRIFARHGLSSSVGEITNDKRVSVTQRIPFNRVGQGTRKGYSRGTANNGNRWRCRY